MDLWSTWQARVPSLPQHLEIAARSWWRQNPNTHLGMKFSLAQREEHLNRLPLLPSAASTENYTEQSFCCGRLATSHPKWRELSACTLLQIWLSVLEFVLHGAFNSIALHFHMGIRSITASGLCHQTQTFVASSSAYLQGYVASSQTLLTPSSWFFMPHIPDVQSWVPS